MAGSNKALKVVLTGGGTGGHIYPAIAIGRGLREQMPQVLIHYLGTAQGLEGGLIPKENWPFDTVTAAGLERRLSLKAGLSVVKAVKGYFQARQHLKRIKPVVVVGTGGYVCGPVVLAAAHLGIPTLIHEQNAFPGLTNRWLSRVADRICVTFPQSAQYFPPGARIMPTGLPIRKEILRTTREQGLRELGLSVGFRILIVGGSQGAHNLNQAMLTVYDHLKDESNIHWLHITGPANYTAYLEGLREKGIDLARYGNIKVMPYVYKMEEALAVADLVIGRAGAGFLAEIMAKGLPSILIPYPFAAENHQEHNARALGNEGAALVIKEKELNGEDLTQQLKTLFYDREQIKIMAEKAQNLGKPEALELIMGQVLELARAGSKKQP